MSSSPETIEVVVLPLWKKVAEDLIHGGLRYGQTISVMWLEASLREDQGSMAFGLAIHQIRRALEEKGYYLCGRGSTVGLKADRNYTILPAAKNRDVLVSYQRKAIDALARGVILGTNTDLSALDDADRRRHEAALEKIAMRHALVSRKLSPARLKQLAAEK